MTSLQFIIISLACYRLTVLFARDAGPLGVFKKLREKSEMLACPSCVSVWIGLLLSFCFTSELNCLNVRLCSALAFSAVAIILDRCFTYK